MPVVTVLRGFKISVSTLDAFLSANKVPPTEGNPPFYEDHPDRASNLLFSKVGEWGDKKNYRIIVPQRVSHAADTAYVTYSWFMVYAQGELRDDDLPPEAPPAFESLRKEVLSFSKAQNDQTDGKMGTYVVFTEERTYLPEYVLQRNMIVSADATTALLHSPSN